MTKRFSLVLLGILLLAGVGLGQSFLGAITGIVKDPQGAVVAGAKVVATEVATNVPHEGTTNSSGLYSFQDLLPGTYVVTVSAPGFKDLKSGNIILVAGASNRFDAELVVGGQKSETIVVEATAPTLITDSAEVSDLKTGEDIIREPMNRSVLQLLRLNTSTVSDSGSGQMIGGQRSPYSNLTIDGVTTMNNLYGGQSGPATKDQSYESIAEMKIVDGNGSADTPGFASLITTTKGGGNQFHGSAFYQTDNNAFDARGFGKGNRRKGPNLQWYGGSVGGPVWLPKIYNGHNKTFFFATWEHRTFPLAAGNTNDLQANLPTAAFQTGDFSSLLPGIQLTDPFNGGAPFAGNIIPTARLNSVALAFQNNYYPAINNACNPPVPATSFDANYCTTTTSPEGINRYDIRIDHHFSDRDTLSSRFTRQIDPQPGGNFDQNTPIFVTAINRNQTNLYLAETHAFSATLVNEFRVSFSRDNLLILDSHLGNTALTLTGLNLGVSVPAGTPGFPVISFNGSGIEGMGELGSGLQIGQEYSLLDNVSWQRGNHSIKAGVLLRYGKPQASLGNRAQQFGSFGFGGAGFGTGFDYADFLLGIPSTASLNSDIPNVYFRKTDTGLFVQDSWHATSKLTLTYGLRWEYFMPPVDNNNRRANFDPATGNMVVPGASTLALLNPQLPTALTANIEVAPPGFPGRSLLSGRKTNLGPRFGFAYLLDKGTVIRGGYGIYFASPLSALQDSLEGAGLFGTTIGANNSFTGNVPLFQFPSPFSTIPAAGGSSCTTQCLSVSGTDPHIKTPTSQQWNLTVERDLGRSLVARVAYRGFMTTQLPITNDLTVPQVFGNPRNFPLYYSVAWTNSGGIQKMNALDFTLERKFTGGLTFQFAYTVAKNVSDTLASDGGSSAGDSPSNPYNRAGDMGNVYFTPRHRMVNNVVWDVPFGRGQRFGSGVIKPVDYALGGWEMSAVNVIQSGYFLTPTYDGPSALVNNGSPLRPDCSGSLGVSNPSTAQWFNTSAFSAPALGTYGNCGVGVIQGPGKYGFSLGLHKFFKLRESVKLKLEANMVNAFNHPVLNIPEMNFSTGPGTFGTIGVDNRLFPKAGDSNVFNNTNSSINGERHIWMGLRLEF
jgi:hypothetical protein